MGKSRRAAIPCLWVRRGECCGTPCWSMIPVGCRAWILHWNVGGMQGLDVWSGGRHGMHTWIQVLDAGVGCTFGMDQLAASIGSMR